MGCIVSFHHCHGPVYSLNNNTWIIQNYLHPPVPVTEDMRTHRGKICIWGGRRLKGWPNTAARLGWMEESDPEGCDFVRYERSIPLSLTDCTICKCPGLGGGVGAIEIDTLEYQQTEKIETELKDVDRIPANRCAQLCPGSPSGASQSHNTIYYSFPADSPPSRKEARRWRVLYWITRQLLHRARCGSFSQKIETASWANPANPKCFILLCRISCELAGCVQKPIVHDSRLRPNKP